MPNEPTTIETTSTLGLIRENPVLQLELDDGQFLFVNLDRVATINSRPDGKMALAYLDPDGQTKRTVVKRFQIIKTATWFRAERA